MCWEEHWRIGGKCRQELIFSQNIITDEFVAKCIQPSVRNRYLSTGRSCSCLMLSIFEGKRTFLICFLAPNVVTTKNT